MLVISGDGVTDSPAELVLGFNLAIEMLVISVRHRCRPQACLTGFNLAIEMLVISG